MSPSSLALRLLLAGIASSAPMWADGATVQAPTYTSAGIVSAASYSTVALAPNGIASIFGTNLSYNTASLTGFENGGIPTTLGGVTVYISGIAAALYYVSPLQINFLIPNDLMPGTYPVTVVREGVAGASADVTLNVTGPALFQTESGEAIATRLDGSLISDSSPVGAGDWVVLYCAGLGRTIPDAPTYAPAATAAPIQAIDTFSISFNGTAIDPSLIEYAGLAPGYAGLYQVNFQMPKGAGTDPDIQIAIGTTVSVPNIVLPAE